MKREDAKALVLASSSIGGCCVGLSTSDTEVIKLIDKIYDEYELLKLKYAKSSITIVNQINEIRRLERY